MTWSRIWRKAQSIEARNKYFIPIPPTPSSYVSYVNIWKSNLRFLKCRKQRVHNRWTAQKFGGRFAPLRGENILPLPAPVEAFPFQRHIKTKSGHGNYVSITDCNRASFAKLAPRGFHEELNTKLHSVCKVKSWPSNSIKHSVLDWGRWCIKNEFWPATSWGRERNTGSKDLEGKTATSSDEGLLEDFLNWFEKP